MNRGEKALPSKSVDRSLRQLVALANYVKDVAHAPPGSRRARIEDHVVVRFVRALIHEIGEDDISGMAAEMAYHFVFAIFPLLLFVVSILGFASQSFGLGNLAKLVVSQSLLLLPTSISVIFDPYVSSLLDHRSSTYLTLGLIGTLWGASGGVGALIKGLNRAYEVKQPRPFWKTQLLALLATFTLPVLGAIVFGLLAFGHGIVSWLILTLRLPSGAAILISVARLPILVVLLIVGLSLVYHTLPNARHRYVWSLPGSVLATVSLIVLSQAFGYYVGHISRYANTYGSFSAAAAFLLWLYLTGIVILIGAEINALLEPRELDRWRFASMPRSELSAEGRSAKTTAPRE